MLAIGAVALSAVAFVLWLICRGSDGKQAQHERIEHELCEAAMMTVCDLEAEARADALCREAAK